MPHTGTSIDTYIWKEKYCFEWRELLHNQISQFNYLARRALLDDCCFYINESLIFLLLVLGGVVLEYIEEK